MNIIFYALQKFLLFHRGFFCGVILIKNKNTNMFLIAGCNPNPCKNGGVCTPTGCVCGAGYTGKFCDTLISNLRYKTLNNEYLI